MISKIKIAALVLMGVCASEGLMAQTATSKNKVSRHNSRNSLDWSGTYTNGLISLNLFNDNSYYYKNGNILNSGDFKWGANGSTITLVGTGEQFKVREGSLKNMSNGSEFLKDGNNVAGDGDGAKGSVTVSKKLLGGKWMLVELNGKAVKTGDKDRKQPYISFLPDGTFSGNGGCNGFGGNIERMDDFKVKFGSAISTMMACLGDGIMETESGFHAVLKAADNYTVKDGMLSLNKARMAPLARFKFVAD